MKVLLTGATGFIGSNIAKYLYQSGHSVIATCRTGSKFEKCSEIQSSIEWINTDHSDWKLQIKKVQPEIFIHSAWSGIEVNSRENWETQFQNFRMSKEYFDLVEECHIKKIIALGSQAEYGRHNVPTNEESHLKPDEAYGTVKSLTANYLRIKFQDSPTHWYWIRIFSLFGENENTSWLMPTVIKNLLNDKTISLTPCAQKYNYLYVGDFLKQLGLVIMEEKNKSGIYNICNNKSIPLKDVLLKLPRIINKPKDLLRFGELPYRSNQNMLIQGDNRKFRNRFKPDPKQMIGLEEGLRLTIKHHIEKQG